MNSDEMHKEMLRYEVESASQLIVAFSKGLQYCHWFPLKAAVLKVASMTDLQRYIDLHGIEVVCRNVSAQLTMNGLFVDARRNIAGSSHTAVFNSKEQRHRFWRNRDKLPRYKRGAKTEYDNSHLYNPQDWS